LVPPGLPGYEIQNVAWKGLARAQCQASARKLYAEAGYGPDKPLRIVIHGVSTEARRKICAAIIEQWRDVLGVDATATADEVAPGSQADPAVGHLTGRGWNADYADANSFLEIWKSDAGDNTTGYHNEGYDALVRQAARAKRPGERAKLLEEAERTLLGDLPAIPLFDSVLKKLVRAARRIWSPRARTTRRPQSRCRTTPRRARSARAGRSGS